MPDVVARVLVEAGHEVFLLRNVLPKKSVDFGCAFEQLARIPQLRSRILEMQATEQLRLWISQANPALTGNINFA